MKLIKGIYLPDSDTHFAYHLEHGPEFEGAGTYQFRKIQKGLDIVREFGAFNVAVDVGAHAGMWTRVLGYHFRDTYAFEPIDELRHCLMKNIANCPNAVHTYNYAIASVRDSTLVMTTIPGNTGNAHIRPITKSKVVDDKNPVVPTKTLDQMEFSGPVNFLKVDVEGYELDVLKGATRILSEDKPIIVIEQKRGNAERYGWKQHAALDYLKSLGYEPVWEMSGDHCVKYKG